ncbi:MAG: ATP synthase F1 subunit gamma [Microscillaceae bacterium]|nr:ATP synthase F1 subunit gamma [Microscillaceae bacterium]MDW8460981.1 ATP synthase F1 subunit gamma [Cytophagales bacterium]
MPSLKEVRNRIKSVESTQQITKAMKMVSAAKLRKAQENILHMRPYSQMLTKIIANLSANISQEDLQSPYTQVRSPENVLIIIITSDRGLCGAFNSNIVKASIALAQEKYASQWANQKVSFLCVGKKGYEAMARRQYKVNKEFLNLFTKLNFDAVRKAAEYILDSYAQKIYDRVEIVYNEFKNVATQIIRQKQFLPIVAEQDNLTKTKIQYDYILEPSREEIIQELIPKALKIEFYKALLDSNAAEHGARMTAMDKATENAGELLKILRLVYNRTRQDAITKEILEIVGGAEALKHT